MRSNTTDWLMLLNRTTEIPPEKPQGCPILNKTRYPSIIGIELAVPQWEALFLLLVLSFIILLTIVGNILVILSVFTYKPLRIVQNFFIVSLAVADLTVAVLVLPFNVVNMIVGRWEFGIHMCKMWLTSDVMCCTSSILNLCVIALDRYWAITDPINYAQKRTVERVLMLIAGVWILSLVISSPPLVGWNDWPEHFDIDTPCMLNSNPGYRIYSALGSFFIPLVIMTIVYIEIYIATRRRLRERARASRYNPMLSKSKEPHTTTQQDQESISSEVNPNEKSAIFDMKFNRAETTPRKEKRKKISKRKTFGDGKANECLLRAMAHKDSMTSVAGDTSSETHSKNITEPSGGDESCQLTARRPSNSLYQFIEERQRISLSKERRAARTLGIIMGVFILCWVPFFLLYIITPFCSTCCPSDQLIDFLTWLGYINSALNPIIYTIFNMDYRRAFKKLLRINS